MPTSTVGALCTGDDGVDRFLQRTFDEATGSLQLPRQSVLWDVVESAHAAGQRGQGCRVGVLDTGFDLGLARLARSRWADPATARRPVRGHGFAVMLLINEVAPDAEFVVHDIRPGLYVHAANVAGGIDLMVRQRVDVVNLSLGFSTDAVRTPGPGLDLGPLFDLDADADTLNRLLDRHRDGGLFGCVAPCPICDRLTALAGGGPVGTRPFGPGPVVIAAGGNTVTSHCPSAHAACIGVGFDQEGVTVAEGRVQNTSALPANDQSVWCDVVLPLPDAFDETSFAAPLLSGVAALDPERDGLTRVAAAGRTVQAVLYRHGVLTARAQGGSATPRQGGGVRDAYRHALDALPPSHQHWRRDDPPCATCGLLIWQAYKGMTQTSVGVGDLAQAREWADAALRLCPLSFDFLLDKAAMLRFGVETGRSPSPDADVAEALDLFRRARARRSSNPVLDAFCREQIELTARLRP